MKELIAKKTKLMTEYLRLNGEIDQYNFHACIFSMNEILKQVSALETQIGKQNENMVW